MLHCEQRLRNCREYSLCIFLTHHSGVAWFTLVLIPRSTWEWRPGCPATFSADRHLASYARGSRPTPHTIGLLSESVPGVMLPPARYLSTCGSLRMPLGCAKLASHMASQRHLNDSHGAVLRMRSVRDALMMCYHQRLLWKSYWRASHPHLARRVLGSSHRSLARGLL